MSRAKQLDPGQLRVGRDEREILRTMVGAGAIDDDHTMQPDEIREAMPEASRPAPGLLMGPLSNLYEAGWIDMIDPKSQEPETKNAMWVTEHGLAAARRLRLVGQATTAAAAPSPPANRQRGPANRRG